MKKLIEFSFLFAIVAFLGSCANAPEGEKAEVGEAQEETASADNAEMYMVNTANSVINWTGSKPTKQHNGTIKLNKGVVFVTNGTVTGGDFELDMNSITDLDMEGGGKSKLEGHLKSGDFFQVDSFPTGNFAITNVEADGVNENGYNVTGNLTLKGITKSVTFPANIQMQDGALSAVSSAFTIDRTLWDVKYNSGTIGTLADNIIHDEVGLVLQLVAAKQEVQ